MAAVTATVRVRIGTVDLTPADILYVGASPTSLIYQVNLRVPGLPNGNQPIQIFLNDVASPANAFLAIAEGPRAGIVTGEGIIIRRELQHSRRVEDRLKP